MANKLSVSQSTYSEMESGKTAISEEKLKEIAEILEVAPEIIEGYSDQIFYNLGTQSGQYNVFHITNTVEKFDELCNALLEEQKKQLETMAEVAKLKDALVKAMKGGV